MNNTICSLFHLQSEIKLPPRTCSGMEICVGREFISKVKQFQFVSDKKLKNTHKIGCWEKIMTNAFFVYMQYQ